MCVVIVLDAELPGGRRADVRLGTDRVEQIGERIRTGAGELVIDAHGGALLPGLHDHHVHLLSLAAEQESVRCGPPLVRDPSSMRRALQGGSWFGPRPGWVRGVGYEESVAGDLDRWCLDSMISDHPVRVQHRSGQLWVLNSRAVEALGLETVHEAGIERDAGGRATGRLYGMDRWLRQRLGSMGRLDLAAVGARLARFGVTGVTDATVGNGDAELGFVAAAVKDRRLCQGVVLMGEPGLEGSAEALSGEVRVGAVKVMLKETELPPLDDLAGIMAAAHAAGRDVAVHCTTAAELALALGAFQSAGARRGDRIEHASVTPADMVPPMARLGLTVVTQPNFVFERGDSYLSRVEDADVGSLYRCRELVAGGIRTGGGTDAPFGSPDPWVAIRAAVDRRTREGTVLGPGERLSPERALDLFLTRPDDPGGSPRRIEVGAAADACLLRVGWAEARRALASDMVAATIRGGRPVYVDERWADASQPGSGEASAGG